MSTPNLSKEAQLRYVLQWFMEFSELQREDFLPVLAAAHAGKDDQLASALAALTCQDKPVSLFQCRIKLFNDWFSSWPDKEREALLKGVTDIDADFGKKVNEYMINGPKVNGDHNGFSELSTPEESASKGIGINDIQVVEPSAPESSELENELDAPEPKTNEPPNKVDEVALENNVENPIIDNNHVEITAAS